MIAGDVSGQEGETKWYGGTLRYSGDQPYSKRALVSPMSKYLEKFYGGEDKIDMPTVQLLFPPSTFDTGPSSLRKSTILSDLSGRPFAPTRTGTRSILPRVRCNPAVTPPRLPALNEP